MGAVVAEVCQALQIKAKQYDVRIINTIEPTDQCVVLADRKYLNQIMLHLLDNAIQYNRPGGEVIINWSQLPHHRLGINIQDTGYGIAKEAISKLFNPFERLQVTNSTIQGSGLGLTLSQRLATILSGRITVETEIGKGSTFTLELPQPSILAHHEGLFPNDTDQSTSLVAHQPTVLYIEDNLADLRLLEVIFKQRPNITVLTAKDGETGLALAYHHMPHLIVLDLQLPDLLGQDLLLSLQSSGRTKAIPVIVISADATPTQIGRLRDSGVHAYLTKPINVVEFLSLVDEIMYCSEG